MHWSWNWLTLTAVAGLVVSAALAGVAYLRCRTMVGRAMAYWTRSHGTAAGRPAARLLTMHVASQGRFLAVPFALGVPFWLGAMWAASTRSEWEYISDLSVLLSSLGGALLLWLACRSLAVIRKNSYQGAMDMASRAWAAGERASKR